MRFTFLDDSVDYDGFTPAGAPLGAEKAVAGIAPALAQRAHEVQVFNRCAFPVTVDGAKWETWSAPRPEATDYVVAFRKLNLLETIPGAAKRALWFTGDTAALDDPWAKALLEKMRPILIFFAAGERDRYANPLGLPTAVCAPAFAPAFLSDEAMEPVDPPRAIATGHPQAGLDWLIKLWCDQIRPRVPTAELHLFSTLLYRGRIGGTVPDAVRPVLDLALGAGDRGVTIQRPSGDTTMAFNYRQSRVHLYPGQPNEFWGGTLGESQATGLPAVARASAGAATRILNGQTGVVAGADEDFANAAVELLTDRARFDQFSSNARLFQRGRTWAVAAAELEAIFSAD